MIKLRELNSQLHALLLILFHLVTTIALHIINNCRQVSMNPEPYAYL